MSLRIMQTCDRCGLSRSIETSEEIDRRRGGWRELNHGGLRATVCGPCVGQLINSWQGRGESEAT